MKMSAHATFSTGPIMRHGMGSDAAGLDEPLTTEGSQSYLDVDVQLVKGVKRGKQGSRDARYLTEATPVLVRVIEEQVVAQRFAHGAM
ncbi:hypothetical protein HPB52_013046 [Rhipicephalus sanguineus]|uniref:Uncharacterized protein n=1 Tax=Rhipicephalus sanguineus TaxID=34632 RepID=A0A9D4PF25_RHISA|nr:hypothetical protein HPB52_013046 [Rhipicephalus sanguineus]